ncbi:hypothetical protein [Absidia glauca]|uniref:Tyrosine specific protein phosphatases domain-containing protein n=1 Tax=Absidia glauca TaxID=4829 RepID=A0A163ITA3_ABSGL|nr:hypothetical protein [Absidia glauca]
MSSSSPSSFGQVAVMDHDPSLSRPSVPKTSISHPINISWVLPTDYLPLLTYGPLDISDLVLLDTPPPPPPPPSSSSNGKVMGNLALSSCPGKKVRLSGPVRGRAAINRDLDLDFTRMRSFGITTLVCCLEDSELDYLGASWSLYETAAQQHGLHVLRLPMIEGSCPTSLTAMDHVMEVVNRKIWNGENVLTHCRGGVGRAGLFACCWLLNNTLCMTAERAIRFVRVRRSPKAIETMRQAEYVIRYYQALITKQQQQQQQQQLQQQQNSLELVHSDLTLSVPSLLEIAQLEASLRLL